MSNGWSQERRARQRQAIQRWKPWTRSTGPKTAAGHARCAAGRYKGGMRQKVQALGRLLRNDATAADIAPLVADLAQVQGYECLADLAADLGIGAGRDEH